MKKQNKFTGANVPLVPERTLGKDRIEQIIWREIGPEQEVQHEQRHGR
jgi:hypothetical protein